MQTTTVKDGVMTIEISVSPEEAAINKVLELVLVELGIAKDLVHDYPDGRDFTIEFNGGDIFHLIFPYEETAEHRSIERIIPILRGLFASIGTRSPWTVDIRIDTKTDPSEVEIGISAQRFDI